jgi:photosystem II stability/assembly factor-like uncharacterized protein
MKSKSFGFGLGQMRYFLKATCLAGAAVFFFGNAVAQTQTNTEEARFKLLPLVIKEEFEAGSTPGDGEQYMLSFAYSKSDPDRIYMGQDMGAVWVSLDAGKNWNNLKNKGLFARCMIALEADPLDKNLVLAAAHARHWEYVNKDYQGIYRTTDGGINWTRVLPRKYLGEIRNTTNLIAHAPSSKIQALGHATRWYAAFGEFSNNVTAAYQKNDEGGTDADDGFFYSDDAGQTWKEVRELPSDIFGNKVNGIRVHPLDENTVYMYGNKGLFCMLDATTPNGRFYLLSGKNGLPEGQIYGDLYIDKVGKTMIVAVSSKGIYKTINGGESWTLVYAWPVIQKCFVNEGFPDRIYATAFRASGQQIRVSKDGGKTWDTNVNSKPRPGYSGPWQTQILGDMAWVIPDPRNPDKAFVHGNAKNHRTDDGGNNWYPSSGFFNGSQHVGNNHEQMFDPNNPDRFCYFTIDKGIWYTDSRGQYFRPGKMDKANLELSHTTCMGGAMHPDTKTGIILANVGRTTEGKLLRSADNGKSWDVVDGKVESRWFIGFDQQNPDYCYQGRSRSSDAGKTWQGLVMPEGAMIVGLSYVDGKVVFAKDAHNIWRSIDRGNNWEKIATAPWRLSDIFRVHPKNNDIFYTNSSTGQVAKWDLTKGRQYQDFDAMNGGEKEENFLIIRFAMDRRFPDVMYMINQRDNTGNKLFRTQNGGKTWENISYGFPNVVTNGLEVSPVTGEVYISGGNGSRVMLPPYKTNNTAYELIKYKNTYIDKPY